MFDGLPGLENEGIALDNGFQNFNSRGATFQMKPYWSERKQFMFIELLCSSCSLTLPSVTARCSEPLFIVSPSICREVMGPDAMIFSF